MSKEGKKSRTSKPSSSKPRKSAPKKKPAKKRASSKAKAAEDARDKRGRFSSGNPGKPKGAVSTVKRELAEAARDLYEKHAPDALEQIFALPPASVGACSVKLAALDHLANRGWGKPPATVKLGTDSDSPEGILRALAEARGMNGGEE